jgi:thioredoxin-like negative regulator of GroEL
MRRADHVPLEHRRTLVAEANAMLDAARERNPLRATTPLIRGLLRADHPDLTEGDAAAAFTQALELDPRNIEARYALSQVLARNGQHEQALAVVERGLRLQYGRSATVEPLERRAAALRRDRGTSTGGPINPPQSTMEPTLGDKPLSP